MYASLWIRTPCCSQVCFYVSVFVLFLYLFFSSCDILRQVVRCTLKQNSGFACSPFAFMALVKVWSVLQSQEKQVSLIGDFKLPKSEH